MEKIKILGGQKLKGRVKISGSKNAALPILFASLLSDDECVFTNVPALKDIETTLKILSATGCTVKSDFSKHQVSVGTQSLNRYEADYDLVRTMRASVLALGPLLSKYGYAKVSLPGGCSIGARPIDYHLKGLEKLGASIEIDQGYVIARAKKLKGARITFDFPSVGATEQLMMAATLAEGETVLTNCAREPEIVDLAVFLKSMGAQIVGEGSETIHVNGVKSLCGSKHQVMGDRIEAGTFLTAGLATGGALSVEGILPACLEAVLIKFEEAGAKVEREKNGISIASQGRIRSVDLTTLPYPGFPTDMQAQFMALMCLADGVSSITETIFENRFMHVQELARMGADITIKGNSALVRGKDKLVGAPVMATDLRASVCLVIAGLCAEGETTVNRIYHLDRGYEKIEDKLRALGASIERVRSKELF